MAAVKCFHIDLNFAIVKVPGAIVFGREPLKEIKSTLEVQMSVNC